MKHSLIYLILALTLVVTGSLPFRGHDVAKLKPVQTIYLSGTPRDLTITTDTGDWGRGNGWEAAMEQLEATTSGYMFQGTVAYVLLESRDLLPLVVENDQLNPGSVVVLGDPCLDLKAVGRYLGSHPQATTLQSLKAAPGQGLPYLTGEQERLYFE